MIRYRYVNEIRIKLFRFTNYIKLNHQFTTTIMLRLYTLYSFDVSIVYNHAPDIVLLQIIIIIYSIIWGCVCHRMVVDYTMQLAYSYLFNHVILHNIQLFFTFLRPSVFDLMLCTYIYRYYIIRIFCSTKI